MQSSDTATKQSLGTADLLPLVQQYLGATLFRNTHHYQITTAQHSQYLDFSLHRLPVAPTTPLPNKLPLSQLKIGYNQSHTLVLQLVRMLQNNNVVICLATDQLEDNPALMFAVVAVVSSSRQQASQWLKHNGFLGQVTVINPYRAIHKVYTKLPFIVTRKENAVSLKRYPLVHNNPQRVKNQANSQFKNKKYEDALLTYEVGLGIISDPAKKRQRAVLYANSSQCLFQMKLYDSALLYAEIAIALDSSYIKGVFRKLNCLLQLSQMKDVPRLLTMIGQTGQPKQLQDASSKYTRYMSNSMGLFDWQLLFKGGEYFGQYYNDKLRLKNKGKEQSLVNIAKIHPYQLIMVHKPLIYKKSEQAKFGEEYRILTQEISNFAVYDDRFHFRFINLPNHCYLQGQPLKYEPSNEAFTLDVNQIHAKCLRCLQLEKTMTSTGIDDNMGIWEKLYYFQHKCLANCTFLHVKDALVVFALTYITPGSVLTIDFLGSETINRSTLMRQKMGVQCDCALCQVDWSDHEKQGDLQELLVLYEKHKQRFREQGLDKINLYILWELLYARKYRELELMQEYLTVLERYPLWECIINCLRYLRNRARNHLFDHTKNTLKKLIQKYFKVTHEQAVALLKTLL